ncbi:adenosylcobinamide-phosphate synthase CbiB [Vagococcus intermedius]|uniref:Cobalamin biosynthesis protein CobD n=1 Tax=Vagococcus intermedius TaxID=2991418 RepID=A0AAF0CU37_9ENTE|nr:adenosylcobinamide-phosphate synthase CbiB [Vagococcus intermedius]WEG72742.1 adenosylcobinamide-phosphate synthase CbiB [Vagococcus intermedius]WEG74828.1 adenosylcobinamide-phosphate synthase CbiB [Vagococcus intermedius]
MIENSLVVVGAFLLDSLLGDPYTWPHPVKLIGNSIAFLDNFIQKNIKNKQVKYVAGLFLWLIIVLGTGLVTITLLKVATSIHPVIGLLVSLYLSYTTLAMKSLAFEGKKMIKVLKEGSLEEARKQVGMIVGRDTSELNKKEICQATIETIAENTNDGMIAPLFYLVIGGPVLGMMYKAVNTLDSMVGYKNKKHLEVGAVSAILDDVFSFIPARITWLLMMLLSFILPFDGRNAVKIGWRDRYNHKSPNSAFPEAVVAGALGIQLGGTHLYHGVEVYKPTIGENLKAVDYEDIVKTNQLLYETSFVALLIFSTIKFMVMGN